MGFLQDGSSKAVSSETAALKAEIKAEIIAETGADARLPRSRSMSLSEQPLTVSPDEYGLLSDLYQLTMSACYTGEGIANKPASFELFTRRLPAGYGYLIAMGLAQGLEYLQSLSFSPQQILALQKTDIFGDAPDRFWGLLESFRFEGDVWAVPEGTAIFANEPMLRIEAPLWQAQIVETYLLNTLNYQTLIGTRAARLRQAAGPDAKLYEFGTRRAFSPQASVWAARAAIAGGLDATSNVLAALKLGRKPVGTMAHSLVMAVSALAGDENEAFAAFHRYFPGAPLLIDTYDTAKAAQRLGEKVADGLSLSGVRIDSGDLVEVSRQVRSHLPDTPIFASGDLDEYAIEQLQADNACIDGYGLGTKLVTGTPVNGVYKLVEIDSIPVMKESSDKLTYPGRKQIFRYYKDGQMVSDRLSLSLESTQQSEIPLLKRVMRGGTQIAEPESLDAIAHRTAETVQSLPDSVRRLQNPKSLPVEISQGLESLTETTRR